MVNAVRKTGRIVQVGTQQRSTPHFDDAIVPALGRARQDPHRHRLGLPRLEGRDRAARRRARAAHGRLRHVARPRAEAALQPQPLPLHLPLVLGLLGRADDGLGRPLARRRQLGHAAPDGTVQVPTEIMSIGGKLGYPRDAMETPDTQQVLFNIIIRNCMHSGVSRRSCRSAASSATRRTRWRRRTRSRCCSSAATTASSGSTRSASAAGRRRASTAPRSTATTRPGAGPQRLGGRARDHVPERTAQLQDDRRAPAAARRGTDGHDLHVQNFLDCLRRRKRPIADVETGHQSVSVCHLANIAYRTGRIVKWDPAQRAGDRRPRGAEAGLARVPRALEAAERLASEPT